MIKINSSFDTLLDAAGKTLEVAPKLYDDTIQPAAQEFGKTLALIPQAINASLSSVRQWISYREYNVAETEKLLAQKLQNTSPDKIVPPEPYVAVPALQAISYSMNNDELRNLYANLLAKSMNSDTKDSVHPAFVEIIKQLSPLDAKVFKHLYHSTNAMVDIVKKYKNSGVVTLARNITNIDFASYLDVSISIDNLHRLKLIDIPPFEHYNLDSMYKYFYKSEIYKQACEYYKDSKEFEIDIEKKSIKYTDIGRAFYKICAKE